MKKNVYDVNVLFFLENRKWIFGVAIFKRNAACESQALQASQPAKHKLKSPPKFHHSKSIASRSSRNFHCAFLRNDQSFDAVYFGLYTDIRLITRSFQLLVSGVKSGPHPTHRPASYSAGAASSAFSVSVSLNLEQTLHLSSSVSCSPFKIDSVSV